MQTQIADIIVPAQFTAYQVENSLVSTALFQSGVVAKNGSIADQLAAGAQSFTVPSWKGLPDVEADITNDDSAVLSTPQKLGAGKLTVRKSLLHAQTAQSISPMGVERATARTKAKYRDSGFARMTMWRMSYIAVARCSRGACEISCIPDRVLNF